MSDDIERPPPEWEEKLREIVKEAHAAGWQVTIQPEDKYTSGHRFIIRRPRWWKPWNPAKIFW